MHRVLQAATVGVTIAVGFFAVNFLLTSISPDRYRNVIEQAARDGTLTKTMHFLLAPEIVIDSYSGNECLFLTMLIMPRESRLRASISPRMPANPVQFNNYVASGYPRGPYCPMLAAMMQLGPADGAFPQLIYYHRYLHGDLTVMAVLLAVLPLGVASNFLMVLCYGAFLLLGFVSALRMRGADAVRRRRAAAFVIMAIVLIAFYDLSLSARQFSFAPTDLTIAGFLLFGFFYPLCRLSETWFVLAAALFGATIAAFEVLTGGIPMAFAVLITLIALGEASDARVLRRRLVLGVLSFAAAILAAFAAKLVMLWAVWGTGEIIDFFVVLQDRMVGPVALRLPTALSDWLHRHGIDINVVDSHFFARLALVGVMLTYSSFFLGWGSHILGVLLVLLPLPILAVCAIESFRGLPWRDWAFRPLTILAAAGLIPAAWYVAFTNHTVTHSAFMVRPMAWNIALAIIAVMMTRQRAAAT